MPQLNDETNRIWWKEGVVYQIYPASFKDSNDDGIGDISGIISKLDYLRDLGIDIIWISPHYKSPQVDMGYDISDFEDIHEPYGTLADCERLIKEIHLRGMKVIFDLVINHTSDQHPWFLESRSSKTNAKRDWYFWRPPKYDNNGKRCRPNNWRSQFTKPAWTWDEQTQEYYLHIYASGQPDLNWENVECRKAVYDSAIRFWLDRGVDGFRVDVVNKYSKAHGLPDAPVTEPNEETQVAMCHYANGPRIHEFLQEMREVMSKYEIMTVGELPDTPDYQEVLRYISPKSGELSMVFNFDTLDLGKTPKNKLLPQKFTNGDFKENLIKWQTMPERDGAWTTVFLENHDQPRSVSKFAADTPQYRQISAKMLATVLTTMTGTLFLYQGQEIGMINAPVTWQAKEYKCVRSVNYYQDVCERTGGDAEALRQARENLHLGARDHARVPMQWNDSPNAGFCSNDCQPWMSVLETSAELNVDKQWNDEFSVLSYWRKLLVLRKKHANLFVYGNFKLEQEQDDLLVFVKTDPRTEATSLTVANLSETCLKSPNLTELGFANAEVIISTHRRSIDTFQRIDLEPFEAFVLIRS